MMPSCTPSCNLPEGNHDQQAGDIFIEELSREVPAWLQGEYSYAGSPAQVWIAKYSVLESTHGHQLSGLHVSAPQIPADLMNSLLVASGGGGFEERAICINGLRTALMHFVFDDLWDEYFSSYGGVNSLELRETFEIDCDFRVRVRQSIQRAISFILEGLVLEETLGESWINRGFDSRDEWEETFLVWVYGYPAEDLRPTCARDFEAIRDLVEDFVEVTTLQEQ
jgi:hypothetical protein